MAAFLYFITESPPLIVKLSIFGGFHSHALGKLLAEILSILIAHSIADLPDCLAAVPQQLLGSFHTDLGQEIGKVLAGFLLEFFREIGRVKPAVRGDILQRNFFRVVLLHVLYVSLVNISAGSDLTGQLTDGFAQDAHLTKKQQVNLLTGLIINETANADEQYVYASELKLLAAVSAQQLDVILMDTAARDQLQDEEYFLDLRTLDADFGSLDELSADGLTLDISDTPLIAQAGFEESVYLGVIANAPHPERAAAYIRYLLK